MRSSRKLAAAGILGVILAGFAFAMHLRAQTVLSEQRPKATPAADNGPISKNKDSKSDGAAAGPAASPKDATGATQPAENERMHDIPVAPNHPAKGLKIPYFDNEGNLQMIFVIGVASRIDADHIDMSDAQIETFDANGQHEMAIDLPTSVLDLNTSVISTKKHVTIRREDFLLTGETMEFNTKTKQGSLGGSVRMLIYNLSNDQADKPSPPVEPKAP